MPFRDLFVELGDEIVAALQGIGEEAARAALPSPAPQPVRAQPSIRDRGPLLCERYGWLLVSVRRSEVDCTTIFLATHRCGHTQAYEICDRLLAAEAGPRWQIDAVDRVVDETPRRCYCVPWLPHS
jgi:hypothetical protein